LITININAFIYISFLLLLSLSILIGLDFYQCIMLINYIRRQTSLLKCFSCGEAFEDISELGQHMKEQNHYTAIPSKDQENGWNDVKYVINNKIQNYIYHFDFIS